MQMCAAPPALRMKTFGQHQHNFVELITREITERIGALIEREEVILAPFLRPDFGHDLLRQNVERLRRHGDVVQLAAPRRVQQRGAVAQFIARQRKEPALRYAADRVTGAPDALQERCDRARRADLAHQIDIADIDPQLERRGRDQGAQFTALQSLLGIQPLIT